MGVRVQEPVKLAGGVYKYMRVCVCIYTCVYVCIYVRLYVYIYSFVCLYIVRGLVDIGVS